jgi:hypothetical protein
MDSLMSINSYELLASGQGRDAIYRTLYPATSSKSSGILHDILSKYNGKDIAAMPTVIE